MIYGMIEQGHYAIVSALFDLGMIIESSDDNKLLKKAYDLKDAKMIQIFVEQNIKIKQDWYIKSLWDM